MEDLALGRPVFSCRAEPFSDFALGQRTAQQPKVLLSPTLGVLATFLVEPFPRAGGLLCTWRRQSRLFCTCESGRLSSFFARSFEPRVVCDPFLRFKQGSLTLRAEVGSLFEPGEPFLVLIHACETWPPVVDFLHHRK